MKGATLFSGFGGVDIGMMAASIDVVWGIEYDDKIAQVNRDNLGDHTITADILKCNPADFERPNLLHASPPCPNFSNAKANAEESPNDKALADKVAEFIRVLLPDFFTLENVYQYRNSQSWQTIARTLLEHGYQFNYWHVNAADYGVPQTRKRMIIIARRDGIRPMLPAATHDESPQNSFFENKRQWIGWYEAIEDLIPILPDSKFAPWQLKRLPEEYGTILSCRDVSGTSRHDNEPCNTVTADSNGKYRAFIVPGGNASSFSTRNADEPMRVVGDIGRVGNMARAFVMNEGNPNGNEKRKYRFDTEPIKTVTAGGITINAFIDGQQTAPDGNGGRRLTTRNDTQPSVTISSSNYKSPHSAIANGRVVKMTPRALARFQSFPDWYNLPESNSLATKGIGNAVPPLLYQRIAESLT